MNFTQLEFIKVSELIESCIDQVAPDEFNLVSAEFEATSPQAELTSFTYLYANNKSSIQFRVTPTGVYYDFNITGEITIASGYGLPWGTSNDSIKEVVEHVVDQCKAYFVATTSFTPTPPSND